MDNIILTLSTVPNRLLDTNANSGTKIGLKTILEQSFKNYIVHFNIPYYYGLDKTEIYIPDWLRQYQSTYNNLIIFRTEDYGPITKIFPTLERTNDPDAIIITVDDDLFYMDGLIEAHLNARQKYPDYAIGFAGISGLDGSCHFCTTLPKDTKVKVLEGYKTVSYKRKFFELEEFKNNFMNKSWNDDYILSAYMGYKDISKIVLSHTHDDNFSPRVESFPVIGHTPIDRGGCSLYREMDNTDSEKNIHEWYRLGYLEK